MMRRKKKKRKMRRRRTSFSHIVPGASHLACGTLSLGLDAHRQGGERFLPPAPSPATVQPLHGALIKPTGRTTPLNIQAQWKVSKIKVLRSLGRGGGVKEPKANIPLHTDPRKGFSKPPSPLVPNTPPRDLQTQYRLRVLLSHTEGSL